MIRGAGVHGCRAAHRRQWSEGPTYLYKLDYDDANQRAWTHWQREPRGRDGESADQLSGVSQAHGGGVFAKKRTAALSGSKTGVSRGAISAPSRVSLSGPQAQNSPLDRPPSSAHGVSAQCGSYVDLQDSGPSPVGWAALRATDETRWSRLLGGDVDGAGDREIRQRLFRPNYPVSGPNSTAANLRNSASIMFM